MIQCICLSCLTNAPFVDVLLARPSITLKLEGDKATYSNLARPVTTKEVFAVPQNPRVEQTVVDGSPKLSVTEVWSGTVRQQVLDDFETAVLAGICPEL